MYIARSKIAKRHGMKLSRIVPIQVERVVFLDLELHIFLGIHAELEASQILTMASTSPLLTAPS